MRLFKLILTLGTVIASHFLGYSQSTATHTVDRGETISSIAQKYNITVEDLIKLNPEAADFIYAGMELIIPASEYNQPNVPPSDEKVSPEPTLIYRTKSSSNSGQINEINSHDNDNVRIDSDGNAIYHHFFVVAEYQIGDFDIAKESGCYGLGLVASSISHWGILHVGANLNLSLNEGLLDPSSVIVDFGPSIRLDINKNCFVNIPINALCSVSFPEGTTDMKSDWGAKISTAIHGFLTNRFGLFVGPQLTIGDGGTSFGMVAGLSYAF